MINAAAFVFMFTGLLFFITGSIGLLRLPDIYSRLHALTKADNVGLGLLITGLALYRMDLLFSLKLLLIWLAMLAASSASASLIAQYMRELEKKE